MGKKSQAKRGKKIRVSNPNINNFCFEDSSDSFWAIINDWKDRNRLILGVISSLMLTSCPY